MKVIDVNRCYRYTFYPNGKKKKMGTENAKPFIGQMIKYNSFPVGLQLSKQC